MLSPVLGTASSVKAVPVRAEQDRVSLVRSESAPKTSVRAPASPVTGAPVTMSWPEFRKLMGEDRQRAIAQVLAFAGAKDRIKNAGLPTLAQALELELDYQRQIASRAASTVRDGQTRLTPRGPAKRDRSKGARPLRPGGTASMKPNVREETFYGPVTLPYVEGYHFSRPIGRGEKLIVEKKDDQS